MALDLIQGKARKDYESALLARRDKSDDVTDPCSLSSSGCSVLPWLRTLSGTFRWLSFSIISSSLALEERMLRWRRRATGSEYASYYCRRVPCYVCRLVEQDGGLGSFICPGISEPPLVEHATSSFLSDRLKPRYLPRDVDRSLETESADRPYPAWSFSLPFLASCPFTAGGGGVFRTLPEWEQQARWRLSNTPNSPVSPDDEDGQPLETRGISECSLRPAITCYCCD